MKRTGKILLTVLVLMVAIRVAMPSVVKWYVNKTLDEIEGYEGYVTDIDIMLWRGAYRVEGVIIAKIEGHQSIPFVDLRSVDLSIQWKEIFQGHLVGEIDFKGMTLNFIDSDKEGQSQDGSGKPWQSIVKSLIPIQINRLTVGDSSVNFKNLDAKPPVDVQLRNIDINVSNLTNTEEISESLFAKAIFKATSYREARLEGAIDINPYAATPSFDLKSKILDVPLISFNDFFKHYLDLDFQDGSGSIVIEVAAKEGKINGYVKPLFTDLDVLSMADIEEGDGLLQLVWEGSVGMVSEILENQSEDQVATKVQFEGKLDDPDLAILDTIGYIFKNAFIEAFRPIYEKSDELKKLTEKSDS